MTAKSLALTWRVVYLSTTLGDRTLSCYAKYAGWSKKVSRDLHNKGEVTAMSITVQEKYFFAVNNLV